MTTLHFIVTNQPVASSSVTFIFSVLICAGHFWWLFSVLVAHCWRSLSLPWFSLKIVKRTSILGLIQTTSFRTGGTLCTAVSRCLTSIASCTWKVWPAAVLVPGSGGEAMGNWGWWKGDRENLPTPPFPGVRPCQVDGGAPWWCGMPPIRLCVRMKGLQPLSPFSSHLSLLPPCFMCVCVCVCESVSRVRLFMTPWTVAHQAPLSMEFSRQEYWSGLPFPSSRGSSQPRDWTRVSCIVGRFLTIWATRAALHISYLCCLPPFLSLSLHLFPFLFLTHVQTHLCAAAVVGATHYNNKAAFLPPTGVLETLEGCLIHRKVKIWERAAPGLNCLWHLLSVPCSWWEF